MTPDGVSSAVPMVDPFDLQRFLTAQEPLYEGVLSELRAGWKMSHWIWFIFPQIDGLGMSSTTKYYAIKSREEARQYLAHPVLGVRLVQCAEILLKLQDRTAEEIFGSIDEMKVRSSMTLFAALSEPGSVFSRVLDRYYKGEPDPKTLDLLNAVR